MSTIITKSFGINLHILQLFGLYAPAKITSFYHIRSYLMYFLLTYPVPVLGGLYLMLEEEIDSLRLGDDAFLVSGIGCHITKLMPFVFNASRMKKCIHYLENPIFAAKIEKHGKILEKCVTICQRNSQVFLICAIGGLISLAVRPFLGNERRLPIDAWLPFSITKENNYFSAFGLLLLGIGYASIASAAIDPLIGGLACLAAGQLQILKTDLQTLNDGTSAKTCAKNTFLRNKIKQCVKHHNAILIFLKEYEECFSLSVTSQFAASVLVICFCCLQLSKISPTSFNFISIAGCLSVMLIQIYFYCYYGTIVYEESNTLASAVYMGKWYTYDTGSRKDLIVLMERSQRPIIITAGKILDLSVITFTGILKKSYSLFAVLKNQ